MCAHATLSRFGSLLPACIAAAQAAEEGANNGTDPTKLTSIVLVQQFDASNDQGRNDINNTTADFYYVPKLADPAYFMTFDPAITADWETNSEFASVTVTFGRMLGKAFGGDSQVYIKPQVLAGKERPADWSIQIGYKILGF